MRVRKLKYETLVTSSGKTAFEFCSDPNNVPLLAPQNMNVKITNDNKIDIGEGVEIFVKMTLYRFLPVKWITKIIDWHPYSKFVDIQPKGPYRFWKHTHTFEPDNDNTKITDIVEFVVPGFIFEPLIYHLFVKKSLEQVFSHRQIIYSQYL